jgi:hypothetical protein
MKGYMLRTQRILLQVTLIGCRLCDATARQAAQLVVESDSSNSTVQIKLNERKPGRRQDERGLRIQDRLVESSARTDDTYN